MARPCGIPTSMSKHFVSNEYEDYPAGGRGTLYSALLRAKGREKSLDAGKQERNAIRKKNSDSGRKTIPRL